MTTLKLITAPVEYPITSAQVQEHLRLSDAEVAALSGTIALLISEATRFVEDYTWRALVTQEWEYHLDEWPDTRTIRLPKPPLQSVEGVFYTLDGESEAEFEDYHVDTDSEPGRIVLERNASWPAGTLSPANPIRIAFACGYPDGEEEGDPPQVEPRIIQAMLLRVTEMYSGVNLRNTIDNILVNYRVMRF